MVDLCYHKNVLYVAVKNRNQENQEAEGLLNNLGIKTPLSKIPLLNVLF